MSLQIVEDVDRRSADRRTQGRLAELSLPELRRMIITSTMFVVVLALFVWMVRNVLIAAIVGVVIAVYLRPLYARIRGAAGRPWVAAIGTLTVFLVPIIAALVYSYMEISGVVEYLSTHQTEIASQINAAIQRLPFGGDADVGQSVRRAVDTASDYGARLPGELSALIGEITVSAAVFLFTAFYVLTDLERIVGYLRAKVPPRYAELANSLESNVQGVLYGAVYATLVTQTIKSVVILAMNLLFGVPLAVVLAIVSFIIGFFPVVGSWSVYLPVAIWLLIFRDALVPAVLMVAIGFLVNTVFFSLYLRPKLAADRSRVLNFYWMFVALVTGVYTFGIAGILLGPILIGMLKAIIDTVTASTSWRLVDAGDVEIDGVG